MIELKNKINQLAKLAAEIRNSWDELSEEDSLKLADEYPFQVSFEELVEDIKGWNYAVQQLKS